MLFFKSQSPYQPKKALIMAFKCCIMVGVVSLDFRQFGFQTFGLFPSSLGDGGSCLKRIALNVVLCFTIIPFHFNVGNPNSKFCLDF